MKMRVLVLLGLLGVALTCIAEDAQSPRHAIPRQIPYTRQNGDTPDAFSGNGACGAASAVMIAAYHHRLELHRITLETKTNLYPAIPNFPRDYGWYVAPYDDGQVIALTYTAYGYKYETRTTDKDREKNGQNASSYGAYGYIHAPDGSADPYRARNFFWKHGLYSKCIDMSRLNETDAIPLIQAEIDAGRPVLFSTRLYDTPSMAYGHIVVVRGYDANGYWCADAYSTEDKSDVHYTWAEMFLKGINSSLLGKWMVTAAPIMIGDTVRNVNPNGLNVRTTPSISATEVSGCSPRMLGDTGTVVLDASQNSCFWNDTNNAWVKVRWVNGEGWSAMGSMSDKGPNAAYLEKIGASSSAPSPAPNAASNGLLVRISAGKYHKGYMFLAKDQTEYDYWMCCAGQMAVLDAWLAFTEAGHQPKDPNPSMKYNLADFLKTNSGMVPAFLSPIPVCPCAGEYLFVFSGKDPVVLRCSIATHIGFKKVARDPSDADPSRIRINKKGVEEEPVVTRSGATSADKRTPAGTAACRQNLDKCQKAWSQWRMSEGYDNPDRKNPLVKVTTENLAAAGITQCPACLDGGVYDFGTADIPPSCSIHGR